MSPAPKWFTALAVIAILWNLAGLLAYVSDMMLTAEDVAQMEPAMRGLYESRTWWSTSGTAVAVWGGTGGSVGLLLKKGWARPLLIGSLVGLIVQDLGMLLTPDFLRIAGPQVLMLQAMVLCIAVGLMFLSQFATTRGWLGGRA